MATITPAVGSSTGGGTSTGGGAPAGTVYADAPPAGLAAVTANGTSNDAPALQALLNHVKTTYGAGTVVLPRNKTIKCNAGLAIPTKVQLAGDWSTMLNFSGLTSGAAITVDDSYATPLSGIRLIGPKTNAGGRVLTGPDVTGVDAKGFNLTFEDLHIAQFARGVDVANENTYILDFLGGYMAECGTCVYADLVAAGTGNAGERITFERYTFSASSLVFRATSGGSGVWFKTCSMDYCTRFGYIDEAYVYLHDCHFESIPRVAGDGSSWGTEDGYLIDMVGNPHLHMNLCRIQLGSDNGSGALNRIINPASGPANYGNGRAKIENSTAFSYTSTGGQGITAQPHTVLIPEGATSVTVYSPFLSKWSPVTAQVTANDWRYFEAAHPQVAHVGLGHDTGSVTVALTVAAPPGGVFVKLEF